MFNILELMQQALEVQQAQQRSRHRPNNRHHRGALLHPRRTFN